MLNDSCIVCDRKGLSVLCDDCFKKYEERKKMKKMKDIKKGDIVYVRATVIERFIEKGVISKKDGYYTLALPEGFEYRFPETSAPMGIIHESNLKA